MTTYFSHINVTKYTTRQSLLCGFISPIKLALFHINHSRVSSHSDKQNNSNVGEKQLLGGADEKELVHKKVVLSHDKFLSLVFLYLSTCSYLLSPRCQVLCICFSKISSSALF